MGKTELLISMRKFSEDKPTGIRKLIQAWADFIENNLEEKI